MKDLLTYIPIFILIIVLFKLSDKEIKKTLEKTKASEKLLLSQKRQLEIRVNEEALKLRENRFERMNELSRAAEFGKLAQGIFHDLMTPLTSIILHTETLDKKSIKDIEMINNTLKKTAEASHKMSQYIDNIKISIKNSQIKKECFLNEEVDDVLEILGYKIRKSNISIEKIIDNGYSIYMDQIKIRQILLNLISNAIDSYNNINTKVKKIYISVEKIKDNLIIKIKDNGCGIKKENLDKIFEPFFSTKNKEIGIGIGLTTVKKIVEDDLFGNIKVFSEENKGTCIALEIPHTIYKS